VDDRGSIINLIHGVLFEKTHIKYPLRLLLFSGVSVGIEPKPSICPLETGENNQNGVFRVYHSISAVFDVYQVYKIRVGEINMLREF